MYKKYLFLLGLVMCLSFTKGFAQAYAPSVQASNVQISYKYSSGMAATITWTRGNGNYCLVELKKRNSVYYGPPGSTNINYSQNASYGGGSSLGGGDNYVVYKGTSTSVFIYNLAPNNIYDAYVHEYNDNTILGLTNYYFNTSTAGYVGFNTLEAPASSCSSITSASGITNSAATLLLAAGGGSGRFIMIAPASLTANAPTNGYYYATSTVYGSGAALGAAYGVYNNSGTNVTVTGLAGATTYKAYNYEYTNGTYPTYSTYNYNTKNYTSCGTYTFNTTNIPPTIAAISSYTMCENAFSTGVNLSGIGDGSANENQNLTVTAASSNTALFPGGSMTVFYTSPNTTGSIIMYPNPGVYGTAVFTVTVNDGWTVNNITTTTFTVTVLPIPGAAGAISGATPICAGTSHTYSISPTTNTTGYAWTVPSGFSITSGTNTNVITVSTTSATASGSISVYGTNANACGNGGSSALSVQVDKQPVNPYAGPDQPLICGSSAALNATAVTLPDQGAWTWLSGTPVPSIGTTTVNSTSLSGLTGPTNTYQYIWTVTRPGSVCPSKTDTVTLTTDWNNLACTPAAAFAYSPSSDVASNKVCVNTVINFTDLSVSANTWSWDFNYAGGAGNYTAFTQNTVYTYTTVGTYSVHLKIHSNTTGLDYTTTQAFTVIGAPVTPGMIFGTSSGICQGNSGQYVYSTGTVTDATNYNWSTPTGINIDAYPSPTSIATSYSTNATSGNITVSASNSCGTSGLSSLAVIANPLPNSAGNAIAGLASVCQGQNNIVYSITGYNNATSYTWIDLNNVQTITSNTISMNIGLTAVSGRIYVFATNACGAGDSVAFNITVNPLPGPASAIAGSNNINLCPNPGNLTYTSSPIANATTYNWGIPTGGSIVGGNTMDTVIVNFNSTSAGGTHYITLYGQNACGVGSKDSVSYFINAPTIPQICMVTVDDTSTHNIIYWDKTNVTGTDSFRIYREDVTNVYHQIGTVHYNSLSEFHDYDPVADPNVTTKRYKISSVDSCGIESALSPYHNTVYITDNGLGQFSWAQLYSIENGGNPVNNYVLMVDSLNNGNWYQRASTAGTQQNINDIYYANYSGIGNWRVETIWGISCTPTFKQINGTAATIIRSKSNITNNRVSGIKNNVAESNFTVYPNPTNGNLNITFASGSGKAFIKIISLLGEEIYGETINQVNANHSVDLSNYQSGTYLVQVTTNNTTTIKRIVKN